jgi:hypothetical protein
MLLKLLFLSTIILSIGAAFMGVRILLKSGGKFPDTHVGHNPEMRKRGITCAQQTDTACHSSDGFPGCSCSSRIV